MGAWRRWMAGGAVDRLQTLAMLAVLLGCAAVPGLVVVETWLDRAQTKVDWNIDGPPCPVVDRPSPRVVGRRAPKTFTYGDIEWTRQHGHVFCATLPEPGFLNKARYRVCQFNAPAMVAVKTPDGRKVTYQPGVARPATVTVRHGETSCVMAGWFRV